MKTGLGLVMQICQHLPQRTEENHILWVSTVLWKHTQNKYKLQAHQFVGHTLNPQLLKYEAGVIPTQVMQLSANNMYYLISCTILIHEKTHRPTVTPNIRRGVASHPIPSMIPINQ